MELTTDDYVKLLDEWDEVPLLKPFSPPTFMEVMGHPHLENVWSNILAFFF